MRPAARAQQLGALIREHLDPASGCTECCAIAVLTDGMVQMARHGHDGPMAEALLASAARELGIPDIDEWIEVET